MASINPSLNRSIATQALRQRLQYLAVQWGWKGLAGIILLAISLVTALGFAWPRSHHNTQLAAEIRHLRAQMPRHAGQWIDRSPQASLNVFYQALPAETAATAVLAGILKQASAHHLQLEKADYSLTRNPQADFSRYQITLPIRGRYADIRRFINSVLGQLPTAALNDISFKRQDASADTVEARLRFTIYLGRKPA